MIVAPPASRRAPPGALPFTGPTAEIKAIQIAVKLEARERMQQVSESFQEAGNRGVPECRQQHSPLGLVETAEQQGTNLLLGARLEPGRALRDG